MTAPDITIAKDIMTPKVVSVSPEASLLEASDLMTKGEYNGLPVVSGSGRVLGIITEYDLLSKGTRIHLPTFIKYFSESVGKNKKPILQDALAESIAFTVRDVMNPDPITFKEDTPIEEMVEAFSAHHRVNPVPVTNREGIVTGIVSRYDIIKFYAFMLRKAKNMK